MCLSRCVCVFVWRGSGEVEGRCLLGFVYFGHKNFYQVIQRGVRVVQVSKYHNAHWISWTWDCLKNRVNSERWIIEFLENDHTLHISLIWFQLNYSKKRKKESNTSNLNKMEVPFPQERTLQESSSGLAPCSKASETQAASVLSCYLRHLDSCSCSQRLEPRPSCPHYRHQGGQMKAHPFRHFTLLFYVQGHPAGENVVQGHISCKGSWEM